MKKIFSILAIALLASCTPEEIKKEDPKDCNCDRVVEVFNFNVVDTTSGKTTYYIYTTINDCSGVQRQSSMTTSVAKIGECR